MNCLCNNCSTWLEFDPDQLGQTVTCPNCGLETVLFKAEAERPKGVGRSWKREVLKWSAITFGAVGVGALVLLLMIGLTRVPSIQQALGELPNVVVGLSVFVLIVAWIGLWVLFPVFVYLYLRRMTRALESLDRVGQEIFEKLKESFPDKPQD